MNIARHADVSLIYQGTNISSNIAADLLSFDYAEKAEGDADSLSISLQNRSLKWMGSWLPANGGRIKASLVTHDWNCPGEVRTLNCGEMVVDDPQFSGPPHKFDLRALSIPAASGYNDVQGDYIWDSISIKQLGQYVANKYSLSFVYDVTHDFVIKSLKRTDQTDADLLTSTAKKYNISTKIFANKLVLYEKKLYETRTPAAVYTLGSSNISSYSLAAPTVGTAYAGVVETYSLPNSDTKVTYTFRVKSGGKMLQVNESADDAAQAELAAKAALREANEKQYSGSLTVSLDLRVTAACTVQLVGFGKFDGRYFVDSCDHSYGSGAGQTQIDIHKCLEGGY